MYYDENIYIHIFIYSLWDYLHCSFALSLINNIRITNSCYFYKDELRINIINKKLFRFDKIINVYV